MTTFDELAARADAAVGAVFELDEPARSAALEMKDAVEALHREALVHLVRTLKADDRGRELLFAMVDDPAVHAVFALHGIVRTEPAATVLRVLEQIRPYLEAEGADATLVAVEDGVALLRFEGALAGGSEPAAHLRHEVEAVLEARVPGLRGVAEAPAEPQVTFIPVSALRRRPA